ncbi:MAG: hypothetical protein KA181_01045 [Xylophilus sp.]|nr:hypothetical protein [Xylophilus sp.]
MNSVLDSQAIAIPCPNCGHQISQPIGQLNTNPDLTCPQCSTLFKVDATQMCAEVAKVDQALADLQRTLGKFSQ